MRFLRALLAVGLFCSTGCQDLEGLHLVSVTRSGTTDNGLSGDSGNFSPSAADGAAASDAANLFRHHFSQPNWTMPPPADAIYDPHDAGKRARLQTALRAAVAEAYGAAPSASRDQDLEAALLPYQRYARLAFARQMGGIVLPPGGIANVIFDHGYCLDSSLAGPGTGEQFRLVSIGTLLPPEFIPIYRGLMGSPAGGHQFGEFQRFQVAALTNDAAVMQLAQNYTAPSTPAPDAQGLVWLLRHVAQGTAPEPLDIGPQWQTELERAYPGALQRIYDFNQRKHQGGGLLHIDIRTTSTTNSLFTQPADQSAGFVNGVLRGLLNQASPPPSTGAEFGFTAIEPGVIAHTSGNGLQVQVDLANTTSAPVVFVPAEWVAQASRQVQRVALPNSPSRFRTAPRQSSPHVSQGEITSLVLDLSEVGNFKALLQALTGEDIITGQPVDRWVEALAMIPIVGQAGKLEAAAERAALRAEERGATRAEASGLNESQMLGEKGTQFTSKSVYRGPEGRLDVENPNPGQRPGQIHFQNGGEKYLYDRSTNSFPGAPNRVNAMLNNPNFQAAVQKALRFLGESQ